MLTIFPYIVSCWLLSWKHHLSKTSLILQSNYPTCMPESNHLFPLLNAFPPPWRHRLTNTVEWVSEKGEWGGREDMEGWPWSGQRTNWARSITSREKRLLESVVHVCGCICTKSSIVWQYSYFDVMIWKQKWQKPAVTTLAQFLAWTTSALPLTKLKQLESHKHSQFTTRCTVMSTCLHFYLGKNF